MKMGEESQLCVLPRLTAEILRRTSSVRLRMTSLSEFFPSLLVLRSAPGKPILWPRFTRAVLSVVVSFDDSLEPAPIWV